MPLQANPRRSLRSGVTSYKTTTPIPKQTHLTPLNRVIKRTYSKSSSTESVSSRWEDTTLTQCGYILPRDSEETDIKRTSKSSRSLGKKVSRKSFETQTLTQAGFVFHQAPVEENLDYDEEPSAVPKSIHPSRKRRRTELEEPITSCTKSAKKRATQDVVKCEDDGDGNDGGQWKQEPVNIPNFATASMPPPKTPQSTRWREVPSSQSPADTPLSTQSRRSIDVLRSPLKAKSVNISRRMRSPGNNRGWPRMLQVADSMENEDEDDFPKLNLSATSAIPVKSEPLNDTRHYSADCALSVEDHADARHKEPVSAIVGPGPKRKLVGLKSEISDSDNEFNETDEDDLGIWSKSCIVSTGRKPETGSSFKIADSATDSDTSENEETPKHAIRISKPEKTPRKTEGKLGQQFTTPRPARSDQPRVTPRTWLAPTFDHQSTLHHNQSRSPAASPLASHTPSISSPAKILLPPINNPLPQTPPRTLPETESQFQNAWREYSPPSVDSNLTSNLPLPQPRLPMYPVHQQEQQPPQQFNRSMPAPVPPSQATTVDITQRSSPPVHGPPPFSSSPQPHAPTINDDDENPAEEPDTLARDMCGWEAVRLTDSQLLLDSLIDDAGLAGPPISLPPSSPGRYGEER